MPTAFGFIFGITVLLLLMMALGSANNVLYIFVFFLASVSVTATVITNNNLERVRIAEVSAANCFADEEATFKVLMTNKGSSPSYYVDVKINDKQSQQISKIEEIPPHQERLVQVRGEKFPRGRQQVPRSQISSSFPFDLLRSWKLYRKTVHFLVYPARRGSLPFPQSSRSSQNLSEAGLFRDLREYQSSDSPRRIDWRASLKHDKILIKNFEALEERSHSFHWDQTAPAGAFEARLSQMATWIDQADKLGILYSCEVGTFKTELQKGSAHRQLCLEHLALLTPSLSVEKQ